MSAKLSQVAAEVGVSVSTVSRAFSRPDLLSPSTVQRVSEAANRLGYQPNRFARALITGRSMNLGLIVPDIANPFFPPLIKSAQQCARTHGYSLYLANGNEDPVEERAVIEDFGGQVDGLVLCSPRISVNRVRELVNNLPVVLVNRVAKDMPSVLIDTATGMRQAVDHLSALGHQEVVYVAGPRRSWSNSQRLKAMREQCAHSDIQLHVVGPYVSSREAGSQAAERILATQATAVIAFDDLLAVGVWAALSDAGLVIPDDMSIIGCDDVVAEHALPALTSIGGGADTAGQVAVDMLLSILERPIAGYHSRTTLSTRLVLRSSTAPPRAGQVRLAQSVLRM